MQTTKSSSSFHIAIVGGNLSSQGGGVPRSISRTARILEKKGCTVTLFAGYSKRYPFTPKELGIEGCNTETSLLWGPDVLGFFPKALIHLWKTAGSFDLIHLNGAWNLTSFLGGLIARHRHVPYVISCRSHYGDYHFSRSPFIKTLLFRTMERINIKHALALRVTADWEEKTSWRAVEQAKRVIKIPNPVDLTDFANPPHRSESRQHLGLDPSGFYLVHLGRLGKQKNLSFLMHAFHNAQLGANAHLVLVGPPEAKEKENLQLLVKKLNLENQVQFIDFASGRERCHWLAAADLFCLPSHDENFCVAAIEAMASGTHCLLSPYVGVVEFLPPDMLTVKKLKLDIWTTEIQRHYKAPKEQHIPHAETFAAFSSENIGNQWIEFYKRRSRHE